MGSFRSFCGSERIIDQYPYMRLPIFHYSQFETYSIGCSYVALTQWKRTSRKAMEGLAQAYGPRSRAFHPCPAPLVLLLWDIGATAAKLLMDIDPIEPCELRHREEILRDAMAFRPAEWAMEMWAIYPNACS